MQVAKCRISKQIRIEPQTDTWTPNENATGQRPQRIRWQAEY